MERSDHPAAGNDIASAGPPVVLQFPVPHSDPPLPPDQPSILLVPPLDPVESATDRSFLDSSGMRRLMEAVVLFFSAILFLRAMAIEPFGVPTGSMAPTLTGNHKCAHCSRCGISVRMGEPFQAARGAARPPCPNCGYADLAFENLSEVTGDRLLVDKNVFCVRGPRRWEIAVFRCPVDNSKPYVKRVVGLPGERIQIIDGDIWINGVLSRKSLGDIRQMAVPLFDMSFVPQSVGWKDRFEGESFQDLPSQGPDELEPGIVVDGAQLRLDGTNDPASPVRITYRNRSLDRNEETPIHDGFAYNGVQPGATNGVHDFFVEFEIEVLEGAGSLSCQLNDGRDEMTAYFAVGASAHQTRLVQEQSGVVRIGNKRLEPGRSYRIEMAFIDRRVSVAVDGGEVYNAFDLPPSQEREDVSRPLRLTVQGISAVIRKLRLSRDIYYRSSGLHAIREPYSLGATEYFMLGDNSANSDDSRSWERAAVPERSFLGKPFLLHQPSRVSRFELGSKGHEFQSIDWKRIRWLR